MTELEETILLANKIFDRPGGADPDDDLAMLSRQFLRSQEMENQLKALLTRAADALEKLERCFLVEDASVDWQLITELRKGAQ
jgi:hypothetical protein